MIKFISAAAIAAMGVSGYAHAASHAPSSKLQWTGCYAGVNLGGDWSRQKVTIDQTVATSNNQGVVGANQRGSGVVGGGQVGCTYQFESQWVVGAEIDGSATRLKGTGSAPNLFRNGTPVGSGGLNFTSDTKWLSSARARVGYLVRPSTLAYGTVGAAWARTDYTAFDAFVGGCPNCGTVAFHSTKAGYAVGGGVEQALSPKWLLRGEYLFYDIDGARGPASHTVIGEWNHLKVNELRAALSYKF